MKKYLLACLVMFSTYSVSAENLMQVYQQALQSDPVYQNALASFKDQSEQVPQALAALLLQSNVVLNTTYNRTKPRIETPTVYAQKFNTHGYQLNLNQPIFNFTNWARLASAQYSVRAAYADLLAAKQNLMTRVAQAYFSVLLAQDNLRFTLAEKRFIAQQLEQTQQRFRVGLDAITAVYDSRASYDDIIATEIKARNDLRNSREALRAITGVLYTQLSGLKRHIPLVTPIPDDRDSWVSNAERHSYQILAAHYLALSARNNIKAAFGGHLPSLAAVGTYTYSDNDNITSFAGGGGGRTTTASLQLNIPVFSGGLVTSQTRQANAQYVEAETSLEKTRRDVTTNLRQTYNSIISGISQIRADRQAIISRGASLEGTQAAFKVGTRTIVDVLNDQQELTQAQQQYAQDQYNYINNTLALKELTGILNEDDLATINSWLNDKEIRVDAPQRDYHQLTNSHSLKVPEEELEKHSVVPEKKESVQPQTPEQKPKANTATPPAAPENKATQGSSANTAPAKITPSKIIPVQQTTQAPKYTIQLLAAQTQKEAQDFIEHYQLQNQASYYKAQRGARTWYEVVMGTYINPKEAQAAITQLPNALQKLNPWVKNIRS
ncbi:MAG: TolC family outer membrane protein [Legionellales bacterium]|nr:TolC family outer membrane protein [Legionellales bacterium]